MHLPAIHCPQLLVAVQSRQLWQTSDEVLSSSEPLMGDLKFAFAIQIREH